MKVGDFFDLLENNYGKGLYRKINYYYNKNKKGILTKYPIDDFNNWDKEKVKKNRGNWDGSKINTFYFYIKYVPSLVCIDFDTKNCENNELYKKLNNDKNMVFNGTDDLS